MAEGTTRTEAFSDGVFAIAMTLLVLEIRLPEAGGEGLWGRLEALWPSYLAFALSFFVLLVSWVNHHDLMRLVRAESRRFLLANGLLLFFVIFIPFPTAVLAASLTGSEASAAVTFYCGTFVAGSAAWYVLLAAITHDCLFKSDVDPQTIRHLRRNQRIGLLVFIVATLLAPVLPWLALMLTVAVRILWLRIRYETAPLYLGRESAHGRETRRCR